MSEREEYLEFGADAAESDDVEILEVVGVDGAAAPPGVSARETAGIPVDGSMGQEDVAQGSTPEDPGASTDDDPLRRLRADYDNLRKRIDRERQDFELHANTTLVSRLLPVLDNFERALAAEPRGETDGSFREGCIMIYKLLVDELRRQGLQAIDTTGRSFDPQVHDAVATDASSKEPSNTVLEELRRGYLFRNRLLRPAMVKVSTKGDDPSGSD